MHGTINLSAPLVLLAKNVDRACRRQGYFILSHHGVPHTLMLRMWQVSQRFFDQPINMKQRVAMSPSYPYGYCGINQETLREDHSDNKESFCIGPVGTPKRLWPAVPNFETFWTEYYQFMEKVSIRLLAAFGHALGVKPDWYKEKIAGHASALRMLHYPPGQANRVGAHAHTDYGILTILLQESPGLQVQDRQGKWSKVPFLPNTLVVNIGDLMQRLTNDNWISTPHRVIPETNGPRKSLAYFVNFNPDSEITCLPTCGAPKYPPTLSGAYILERHHAATRH